MRAIGCVRIAKPEIHRVDLSAPLLSILAWGASADTFEWFDPPDPDRIDIGDDAARAAWRD